MSATSSPSRYRTSSSNASSTSTSRNSSPAKTLSSANDAVEPKLQRCVSKILSLEQTLANQIGELLGTEKSYRKRHGTTSSWMNDLLAASGSSATVANSFNTTTTTSNHNNNNNNNNNNNIISSSANNSLASMNATGGVTTTTTPQQQRPNSSSSRTNPNSFHLPSPPPAPVPVSPSREQQQQQQASSSNPFTAFSSSTTPTFHALSNSGSNYYPNNINIQQQPPLDSAAITTPPAGYFRGRRRSSTSFVGLPPIGQPDVHQPMTAPTTTAADNNSYNTDAKEEMNTPPSNNNNNNQQQLASGSLSNVSSTNNSASPLRDDSNLTTRSDVSPFSTAVNSPHFPAPPSAATPGGGSSNFSMMNKPPMASTSSLPTPTSPNNNNNSITNYKNSSRPTSAPGVVALPSALQSVTNNNNNNISNSNSDSKDSSPVAGRSKSSNSSSPINSPFTTTTANDNTHHSHQVRPASAALTSNSSSTTPNKDDSLQNTQNNNTNNTKQQQQPQPQPQKSVTFFGTASIDDENGGSGGGGGVRNSSFAKLRRAATNTTVKLIRALTRAIIFDFAAQARGELSLLPLNMDPAEMRGRLKILSSSEFRVNKLRYPALSQHEKDTRQKFDFEDELWRETLRSQSDNDDNDDEELLDDPPKEESVFFNFFQNNNNNNSNKNKPSNNTRTTRRRRRSSDIFSTTKQFDSFENEEREKADRKIKDMDVIARLALTNMKQTDWYDAKFEVSIQKRTGGGSRNNNNQDEIGDENDDEDSYLLLPGEKSKSSKKPGVGDDRILRKIPIHANSKFEGVAESSIRHKREERTRRHFAGSSSGTNSMNKPSTSNKDNFFASTRLPANPSIDAVWAQVFAHKTSASLSFSASYQNRRGGSAAGVGGDDRADPNFNPRYRSRSPAASLLSAASSASSSASNWSGDPIPRLCRCSEAEQEKFDELQEKRRRVREMRQQDANNINGGSSGKRRWSNASNDFAAASQVANARKIYSSLSSNRKNQHPTLQQKMDARKRREDKKGKIMGASFRKLNPQQQQSKSSKGQPQKFSSPFSDDDGDFGEAVVAEGEEGEEFEDDDDDKIPFLNDKPRNNNNNNKNKRSLSGGRQNNASYPSGLNLTADRSRRGTLPQQQQGDLLSGSTKKQRNLIRVSSSSNQKRAPTKPTTTTTGASSRRKISPKIANNNANNNKKSSSTTSASRRSPNNNNKKNASLSSSPATRSKVLPKSSSATSISSVNGGEDKKKNNNNTIAAGSSSPTTTTSAASILAAAQKYRHVKYRRRHHDAVTILAGWYRCRLECTRAKEYCEKIRNRCMILALAVQRFGRATKARVRLAQMKIGARHLEAAILGKISETIVQKRSHGIQVTESYQGWKTMVTLSAKRFLARREVRRRKALLQEYDDHRLNLERNDDEVIVITLQWRYDTLLAKLCQAWGIVDSSWKRSALGALTSALEDSKKKSLLQQQQQEQANNTSSSSSKKYRPSKSIFRRGVTGEASPLSPFEHQRRKSLVRFANEIGIGNEEIGGRFAPASSRNNSRRGSAVTVDLNSTTSNNVSNSDFVNNNNNVVGSNSTSGNFSPSSSYGDYGIGGGGGDSSHSSASRMGSSNNLRSNHSNNKSSPVVDSAVDNDLSPSMRLAAIDAVKRARIGAQMLKHKRARAALKIQKIFRAFWARKFIVNPLKDVMSAMTDFRDCGRLHVHISDKLAIRSNKRREKMDVIVTEKVKTEAARLQSFWSPLLALAQQQEEEQQRQEQEEQQSQGSNDDDKKSKRRKTVDFVVIDAADDDNHDDNEDDIFNDKHPNENDENNNAESSSSTTNPSSSSKQRKKLVGFEPIADETETTKETTPTSALSPKRAAVDLASLSPETREAAKNTLSQTPNVKIPVKKLSQIELEASATADEETKKMTPSKLDFLIQSQFRKDATDPERRAQYHRFLSCETRFFQDHQKLPVVSKTYDENYNTSSSLVVSQNK